MAGKRQQVSLIRFLSAASLTAAGVGSLAIAIIDFSTASIGPPKGHVAYYAIGGCTVLALAISIHTNNWRYFKWTVAVIVGGFLFCCIIFMIFWLFMITFGEPID